MYIFGSILPCRNVTLPKMSLKMKTPLWKGTYSHTEYIHACLCVCVFVCVCVCSYDFGGDVSNITKESFSSHHHILTYTCCACREETKEREKQVNFREKDGGRVLQQIFFRYFHMVLTVTDTRRMSITREKEKEKHY